jgi:hypothetical protein
MRLQQQRWISATWGASENNRRAKFYAITAAGRRQLTRETENWTRISGVIARLLRTGSRHEARVKPGTLSFPQHGRGVEPRGASCRDQPGQHANGNQHRGGAGERRRIAHLDLEEQRRDEPCSPPAASQA